MAGRWRFLNSGKATYATEGDYNFVCQRCGCVYKKGLNIKREWTGLWCCYGDGSNNCWEPRNSQDFVRGVPDKQSVNPASLGNNPAYTVLPYNWTPDISGVGIVGLMLCGVGYNGIIGS